MKQPKRLTRMQKDILKSHMMDPFNWKCVSDNNEVLVVINKKGTIRRIKKEK